MTNLLLTNNNLKNLIENLKISDEQKAPLISSIPQLDEEERVKLLDVLKDIYLLDLEEAEALQKIQNSWQK